MLPLVWMVKHWIIRCLSQSCRLWGCGWNEMHQKLEATHALGLRGEMCLNRKSSGGSSSLSIDQHPRPNQVDWGKVGLKQRSNLPLHLWQAGLWFMVRSPAREGLLGTTFHVGSSLEWFSSSSPALPLGLPLTFKISKWVLIPWVCKCSVIQGLYISVWSLFPNGLEL